MKLWKVLGALSLVFGMTSAQAATLTGTTVGGKVISTFNGFVLLDTSATVGAGIEFTVNLDLGFGGYAYSNTADSSDSTIHFADNVVIPSGGALGTAPLRWTITIAPSFVFASITEQSDTFLNGVSLTSFSGNVATFDIAAYNILQSGSFDAVYDFTLREVSAVPEPSTYALMLAGLGLLGFMARRRKQ